MKAFSADTANVSVTVTCVYVYVCMYACVCMHACVCVCVCLWDMQHTYVGNTISKRHYKHPAHHLCISSSTYNKMTYGKHTLSNYITECRNANTISTISTISTSTISVAGSS